MAVHCFFVPAGGAVADLPALTPLAAREAVHALHAWPEAHAGRILPLVAAGAQLVWALPSLADAVRASRRGDPRFSALDGPWELVVADALVAMADPRSVRPGPGSVATEVPGLASRPAGPCAFYAAAPHLVARPAPDAELARLPSGLLAGLTRERPQPGLLLSDPIAVWLDEHVLPALTTGAPLPKPPRA